MPNTDDNLPATKGDITGLQTELKLKATKSDLADLRTELKTDIKSLDQKFDQKIGSVENRVARLEDVTKNIALDMVKAQSDISDIKERMATRDDISRVLNHIDAFAAEALSYRNHDALRGGKIMEHETKLENHENRLTSLEIK